MGCVPSKSASSWGCTSSIKLSAKEPEIVESGQRIGKVSACALYWPPLYSVCFIFYLHQLWREIYNDNILCQDNYFQISRSCTCNDACCSWLVTSRVTFESLTTAWKGSQLQVMYMFSHWKALGARFYSGLISIWPSWKLRFFLKGFRYSYRETIPIFFNRLKGDFVLVRSL